jgi:mannose-6-phosphate isomerase-like protein (cupin superfamily)
MHQKLVSASGDYAEEEYLLPGSNPVGKTISAHACRIAAESTSPVKHETTNHIFHVIEGAGSTHVKHVEAGKEYTLTWKRGDTFCVPSWHRFEHTAAAGEDTFLFFFTDKPMLKVRALPPSRVPSPADSLGAEPWLVAHACGRLRCPLVSPGILTLASSAVDAISLWADVLYCSVQDGLLAIHEALGVVPFTLTALLSRLTYEDSVRPVPERRAHVRYCR